MKQVMPFSKVHEEVAKSCKKNMQSLQQDYQTRAPEVMPHFSKLHEDVTQAPTDRCVAVLCRVECAMAPSFWIFVKLETLKHT